MSYCYELSPADVVHLLNGLEIQKLERARNPHLDHPTAEFDAVAAKLARDARGYYWAVADHGKRAQRTAGPFRRREAAERAACEFTADPARWARVHVVTGDEKAPRQA